MNSFIKASYMLAAALHSLCNLNVVTLSRPFCSSLKSLSRNLCLISHAAVQHHDAILIVDNSDSI